MLTPPDEFPIKKPAEETTASPVTSPETTTAPVTTAAPASRQEETTAPQEVTELPPETTLEPSESENVTTVDETIFDVDGSEPVESTETGDESTAEVGEQDRNTSSPDSEDIAPVGGGADEGGLPLAGKIAVAVGAVAVVGGAGVAFFRFKKPKSGRGNG